MADKRKDTKGRNLKDNESQMPDGRYRYRYTDKNGNRKTIYSWKLVKTDKVPDGKKDCLSLREKIKELQKDLDDNIDPTQSNTTLNDMWEKYISMKSNLKPSTKNNYIYSYDHFVRDAIGNRKIKSFKYSDIKSFYNGLLNDGMKTRTLDCVHTLLHPTFTLAVRDGIIRNNPTDGVCAELKKNTKSDTEQRHALTIEEQKLFIAFLEQDEMYNHWLPLMTFLLGTGCRISEVLGLRWYDVDFKKGVISINHNTLYRPDENGKSKWSISTPKTSSGIREIPLFNEVRKALLDLKRQYFELGLRSNSEVDGYTDFIFLNRFGLIYNPADINRAIKRIYNACNEWESEQAKKEHRTPIQIRHFSAHSLRHTFCTRLCEVESNIKLIMNIMGHSDVQTTMNIYNEIQEQKKKTAFEELQNKIQIG